VLERQLRCTAATAGHAFASEDCSSQLQGEKKRDNWNTWYSGYWAIIQDSQSRWEIPHLPRLWIAQSPTPSARRGIFDPDSQTSQTGGAIIWPAPNANWDEPL